MNMAHEVLHVLINYMEYLMFICKETQKYFIMCIGFSQKFNEDILIF